MSKHHKPEDEPIFDIDLNRLEYEFQRQAKLRMIYGQRHTDAKLDVAELTNELNVIKSELALSIRDDPDSYGLSKATEASVASAILLQPECKLAQKELNKAVHKMDLLANVIQALEHKKRSLEKLADLYGQEYWSKPNAKHPKFKEVLENDRRKREHKLDYQDPDDPGFTV